MEYEEKSLQHSAFSDLTVNELHVVNAIGACDDASSSRVAAKLGITVGSLTKSVDSLERKGYVLRSRSANDKRVVLLSLTKLGNSAFEYNVCFNRNIVDAMIGQLDEGESQVLEKSLGSLKHYVESSCVVD